MSLSGQDSPCPKEVDDYARQLVEYVATALSLELVYDSETLPILDHYLRTVADEPALVELTATTAGAYFGEVVRRKIGGRWNLSSGDPTRWRLVLPIGLSFVPSGLVAEAIAQSNVADINASFDTPEVLRPHLESAMARMGDVCVEEYYSLCGRFDTLEHLHAVLLAVAASFAANKPN